MIRKLAIVVFLMAFAGPSFAQALQSPAPKDPQALRLMNDTQFNEFLKRLDADIVSWKARLRAVDVTALSVGVEDAKEIRRSYSLSMLALENARGDITQLTQKQTLKLDFLLLVDLNALARSLDRLGSNLVSPVTVQKASFAQKSIGWAREVISIDTAVGAHIYEVQQHMLALAGLLDDALDRGEQNPDPSRK